MEKMHDIGYDVFCTYVNFISFHYGFRLASQILVLARSSPVSVLNPTSYGRRPNQRATFSASLLGHCSSPYGLTPPFFQESGPACRDLRQRCEAQLAARHSAEKVLRCWGGTGTGTALTDTKAAIASLLAEYLTAHDVGEAARRLRELGVPFFHHELVKQVRIRLG